MEARNYTRARRHMILAGRIGDIPIPAATWWQFAAAALTLAVMAATSGMWGTPRLWTSWPIVARATLLPAPILAFWVSGKIRPDGTDPFSALFGLAVHGLGRVGLGSGRWQRRPVRVACRIPVVKDRP